MIPVIVRTIANIASVTINIIAISVTFPRRHKWYVIFGSITLFTLILAIIFYATGAVNVSFGGVLGSYGGVYGLLYLPLIIFFFKGLLFQKIYVIVSQLLISVAMSYLVMAVIEIFIQNLSDTYYLILLIALSIVYAAYTGVMLKYGWSFMKRLFASGRQSEWALYALGAIFSYTALMFLHDASINRALYIFSIMFIIWGFAVLCFAIINTHEKSKQGYDAEFARGIIFSGRDHYQKMNEMYDELRILRHDYKYHLCAIREMLSFGYHDEIDKYLTDIEMKLSESELQNYCNNMVINALLSNYKAHCIKLNIIYNVEIYLPEILSIPNYEMCIVLGNLLQNAIEACQKQENARKIELVLKSQGTQLAIKVKNSFDGVILHDNGKPLSEKKDGGFGLKSIEAVTSRYGGELYMEWDNNTFTSYILIKI